MEDRWPSVDETGIYLGTKRDTVSGISFAQKDGVNIMKGYMESGEFSRGKEGIRADGSIIMVGNFEVDVEHQQHVGHLFGLMPPGDGDEHPGLYRIEINEGPGSGVKILNKPIPRHSGRA